MPIKKLIENDPVLRYRYILKLWKLAKDYFQLAHLTHILKMSFY